MTTPRLLIAASFLFLVACLPPPPAHQPPPAYEPAPPPGQEPAPPPAAGLPHPAPKPVPESPPPALGGPDGASCTSADHCQSGICEGMGCGPDQLGMCMAQNRMCTRDLRQYCGCDGATFQSSGSCPGRRYSSKGACTQAAKVSDGGSCTSAAQCASGVCEGQGCGPDQPGVCMSRRRMCTKDLRPYCGCDGVTFRGSGTCPGRRYAARGACAP